MLVAEGLGKTIGGRCLFRGVSFAAGPGEAVLVTGPNGSGKTTLLNILAGLEEPSEGMVLVGGRSLQAMSRGERARLRAALIGYALQEPMLMNRLTALENVVLSGLVAGLSPGEARREAEALLTRLGLAGRAHTPAGKLSGGERKRVELARALAKKPRVLLLDEPYAMLSGDAAKAVEEEVKDFLSRGGVLVAASPTEPPAPGARRTHRVSLGQQPCQPPP